MILERCWNCGDSRVLCDLRHFAKDVLAPVAKGAVIGSVIGAAAALIQNALGAL